MTSLVSTILKRLLGLTYVEGSSGGWSYRKYADGHYECHYRYVNSNIPYINVLHNASYASDPIVIQLPAELKTIEEVLYSGYTANLGYMVAVSEGSASVTLYFINTSNASGAGIGNVRVTGKWK